MQLHKKFIQNKTLFNNNKKNKNNKFTNVNKQSLKE